MPRLQRLGLFGGSFDPVHNGHLMVARAAIQQLDLDALWLIPASRSPFKDQPRASDTQRLEMLRLAIENGLPELKDKLHIDTQELTRAGTSFTIDTLMEIQTVHPDVSLFLIMGQDAWAGFTQWKRWQDILDTAQPVVVNRASEATASAQVASGPDTEQSLRAARPAVQSQQALTIRIPPDSTSSTEIRERIAAGQTIGKLTPPAVVAYIQAQEIYVPGL